MVNNWFSLCSNNTNDRILCFEPKTRLMGHFNEHKVFRKCYPTSKLELFILHIYYLHIYYTRMILKYSTLLYCKFLTGHIDVRRIINQEDTAIIREVYDNDNSQEMFEQELDNALEAGYKYIIIEPTQLADETVRWITVGNFLSKTAIISGALSSGTGLR